MHRIACVLFFLLNVPAWAASEWIDGFQVKSCNAAGRCLKVDAKKAQRSQLDHIYVFKDATITVFVQETQDKTVAQTVQSKFGYLDLELQTVVLSEVQEQPYDELMLSLKSHKVIRF